MSVHLLFILMCKSGVTTMHPAWHSTPSVGLVSCICLLFTLLIPFSSPLPAVETKPPPTVAPTTSLPNVAESRSLTNRDSKTTAGRSGQDLLAWCQEVTRDCPMVHITDLTTSFQSGLAFCAILHHYYPDKIDLNGLSKNTPVENCRLAFVVASKLGIPRVLDPVELTLPTRPPDLLSMMTYLHQMRMRCCGPPPAEVPKPVVGILQGNGVIPCSPARRPSMGSEQVLTSRTPRPTSATRRCSTENVGSPTATNAPSELASSNRKNSASMRYEHMLSKARQLLEQTRSQHQQQSLAHLPYTDALPPLASTRKPRPHSTFGMPNCGPLEKVKSSSGPDGNAETHQTARHSSTKRKKTPRALMRFNSDGTICMPNGTSAATGGSTTSAMATTGPQSPSPRRAVISNSFTSTDGVKVLHLKLSQLNLFASGRGSTAPVPIRIGEHHFSAKTSSSPTVTRNVIRVEPENSDTLHRPNPVDSKPPSTRAVPSTTMVEQLPALSNYIKNEQDELDRAQQELDREAADLEQRLRHHMKSAPGTAAEEELLRRWFVLVSRKSALIHREHQLSIMEKEDDLKKKIEMLQEEVRRVLSIEEFMKTDSDRRREELLLRDLVKLINERDDMIKELDLQEQALAEELQHEQRANINAHFVSRDRSDRCVIQ
ncbi:EH domain-binding protein 1-like protein 1 [Clonorchis sinensis]|uniref:EH domain-binding protein 1-like protein 1 n=1 Tax=Clonorchis sinensis TaxID=79923 RepID=G7YX50_CLOSI|nr:EH domain-binding protein 1-like protein 1 [Clonorchis sinensis]